MIPIINYFNIICIILLNVFILNVEAEGYSNNTNNLIRNGRERNSKLLSLFTMVTFKNTQCTTLSNETGACYSFSECILNGGIPSTSCAQGYGVCCVTKAGCGQTKSNNCTYLQNPEYPATFNSEINCRQSIKLRYNTCSVRLNIDILQLSPPNEFGNCKEDWMSTNQDNKFQKVCGLTTDNHFYLEVNPGSTIDFDFVTRGLLRSRSWRIQVCQISCDQESLPPGGCGQYYMETIGNSKGFNYDAVQDERYYLGGLNYAICIRSNLGKCTTEYFEYREFYVFCPDTFIRAYLGDTVPPYFIHCEKKTTLAETSVVRTWTGNGPHYFYFTSGTGETKPHRSSLRPTNYNIFYEQKDC